MNYQTTLSIRIISWFCIPIGRIIHFSSLQPSKSDVEFTTQLQQVHLWSKSTNMSLAPLILFRKLQAHLANFILIR